MSKSINQLEKEVKNLGYFSRFFIIIALMWLLVAVVYYSTVEEESIPTTIQVDTLKVKVIIQE